MSFLGGALPLRYCAGKSACKIPTWRLPVVGQVLGVVTADGGVDAVLSDHSAVAAVPGARGDAGVNWVRRPGGGVKRVRLNRKKLQHTS